MIFYHMDEASDFWKELGARYYCELVGRRGPYSVFEEFSDDGLAINHFLSLHSREVNRVYARRARVIYNVLNHVYEKEWVTVPIYTRID